MIGESNFAGTLGGVACREAWRFVVAHGNGE
jgi:hypothetical protein